MRLYSESLSPFASRVRLAIYAKGLDIEIAPPPGGDPKAPAYLAINPIGKIPCLMLDDGAALPESDTIIEYLEDVFSEPPLRPALTQERARARLLARICDLYLMPQGIALMGQLNPAARDPAVVADAFARMDEGLAYVEHFLGPGPYAVGATLSTADCSLAPMLFFLGVFGQVFGHEGLAAKHPRVQAYAGHLRADPIVAKVFGEMGAAVRARMGGR